MNNATLELVGAVIAIVVGVGGLSATIWAVGKVKGLELTVGLLSTGNEALRAELTDAGRRHAEELARTEAERRASEVASAERIARLEGHNAALIDGIADKLAGAIAGKLEAAILEALRPLTAAVAANTLATAGTTTSVAAAAVATTQPAHDVAVGVVR